jgi:hypothetical protein
MGTAVAAPIAVHPGFLHHAVLAVMARAAPLMGLHAADRDRGDRGDGDSGRHKLRLRHAVLLVGIRHPAHDARPFLALT